MNYYVKKDEIFFWSAYFLFLTSTVLSTSLLYRFYIGTISETIRILWFSLLIVGELLSSKKISLHTFKGLLIAVGLYLLLSLSIRTPISTIAAIPLFVYCARNIEFKKIGKFTITITLTLVLITMFFSQIGIIENYATHSTAGRNREFIGFRYALYPSAFMFNIIALYILDRKEKKGRLVLVLLLIISYWFYLKTDARLSFYFTMLLVIVFIFRDKVEKIMNRSAIIRVICTLSFVICFILSIFAALQYKSGDLRWNSINKFLGNRLFYAQKSFLTYGVHLWSSKIQRVGFGLDAFGQMAADVKVNYDYVDCFYIQILQDYGIILTIVFLTIMTLTLYTMIKKKQYSQAIILVFFAMHSLIDDLMLYLYFNTFWFMIGTTLLGKTNEFLGTPKKLAKTNKTLNT